LLVLSAYVTKIIRIQNIRFDNSQRYNPIKLDIGSLLKSIHGKIFEYLEIPANIYKQEVINIRIYNLIIIDILGNKINEFSERENNLLANQDARLSENKHLENKANMLIYLLLLILLLITQKKQSLLFLYLPEQDIIF
jgi:hypothetical protein